MRIVMVWKLLLFSLFVLSIVGCSNSSRKVTADEDVLISDSDRLIVEEYDSITESEQYVSEGDSEVYGETEEDSYVIDEDEDSPVEAEEFVPSYQLNSAGGQLVCDEGLELFFTISHEAGILKNEEGMSLTIGVTW